MAKTDAYTDAVYACVEFANAQMIKQLESNKSVQVASMDHYDKVAAWSCVMADMWRSFEKERVEKSAPKTSEIPKKSLEVLDYYDYIGQCHKLTLNKNVSLTDALRELVNDTFDYVESRHEESFVVNNFAMLHNSTDGKNRKFFEFQLPSEDVITDIHCNMDYEIWIGRHQVQKDDAILKIVAQYHVAKVKIYIPDNVEDAILLSYNRLFFNNMHRRKLVSNAWNTKGTLYVGDITAPVERV